MTRLLQVPTKLLRQINLRLLQVFNPNLASLRKNKEAFANACRTALGRLEEGEPLLAIILAPEEVSPSLSACLRHARSGGDERTSYPVRVAYGSEGFCSVACSCHKGTALSPGELVHWVPVRYDQTNALLLRREEAGWIGVITAHLRPGSDTATGLEIVAEFGRPHPPDPHRRDV